MYGAPAPYVGDGSFGRSPAGTQYYNKTPSTLYDRLTLPYSSGDDPFSRFVRSRGNMFDAGYKAALGTNPFLTAQQYAQRIGLNQDALRAQFMNQAPDLRGVNASNVGGGRVRWIP